MVEGLTHATFAALVGQTFQIGPEEMEPLTMVLIEASLLQARPGQPGREPFSLVFRGPRQPWFPQRMYTVRSETLPKTEFFLVPIGPDQEGMLYQAIFN